MAELQLMYLETPPANIAYIKFIFESYEEVGIVRTVDRKRAVIVLLAMRDFADTARAILESIQQEIPLQEIPPPLDMTGDWFMRELADDFIS
ncbi:MAG TPA: DUF4911 domain-containing protein [Candidatus Binatia bacterium]|nr:DUF4911 domain-containing protein [Candidatus Binatia bacterium]